MIFSDWMKKKRADLGIDLRELAEKTNVDASTLSRIENSRSQIMFATAIRICSGLGLRRSEAINLIRESELDLAGSTNQSKQIEVVTSTTIEDIENFLFLYENNWGAALEILAYGFTEVTTNASALGAIKRVPEFSVDDMIRLFIKSPVFTFDVHPPTTLSNRLILNIYYSGGAMSLQDIGQYIRNVRKKKADTQSHVQSRWPISSSVISRIENGTLENIKLKDAVTLDAYLSEEGEILGMFWEAVYLYMQTSNREIGEGRAAVNGYELALIFLTMCRWYQTFRENFEWLLTLRRRILSEGRNW